MNGPEPGRSPSRAVVVVALVMAAAVLVAAAYWLGSRSADPGPGPTASPTTGAPQQPTDTGPVVLVVSIDGLRADAITTLGPRGTPALHRLMAEGASTLNARTAYESTRTLPNHTGMLTGRGVAGKRGHNVTFNNDNGDDETLAETHGSYVPGMFDVAHDHGRQTAFFAGKDKFHYLVRSWDEAHGRVDRIGPDNGRDKTDIDRIGPAQQIVPAVKATLLDGRTDLVFLHLTAPDRVGHDEGWMSSAYLRAVKSDDARLGSILATVDANQDVAERLTILVTADHGGEEGETTHYDVDDRANYQIPLLAWGRGFPSGADLYALNPQRRNPGPGRPTYAGPQPIRNMDVANTSLTLLGLPPIAGAVSTSWPPLAIRR